MALNGLSETSCVLEIQYTNFDTHRATANEMIVSHLKYGAEVLGERKIGVLKVQHLDTPTSTHIK